MKKYIFILFALAVLQGCQKEQEKKSVTSLEIDHVADSISFDDIVKEYQYIELSQDSGLV